MKHCSICGDEEPFHIHDGDRRIEDHFTVGRGQSDFEAAQAWKARALAAERREKDFEELYEMILANSRALEALLSSEAQKDQPPERVRAAAERVVANHDNRGEIPSGDWLSYYDAVDILRAALAAEQESGLSASGLPLRERATGPGHRVERNRSAIDDLPLRRVSRMTPDGRWVWAWKSEWQLEQEPNQ